MIDLREKLEQTADHLEKCLKTSRDKGVSLGLLFYHTHPNYGQSHVYIVENESAEPEEEVLGQPIDYVIDYDGWAESTTWWDGEPTNGDLELILLNGQKNPVPTNGEFNEVWADQVAHQIRKSLQRIDISLLPRRVVVVGENGESRSDWKTENRR